MKRGEAGRRAQQASAAERHQRIAELTRQGLSAPQIAEMLGVTPRTVVRGRKATGTLVGPAPQEFWLTAEQIDRAEQLLDDGCSLVEVARTIGCTWTSVWKRWQHRGWTKQQAGEYAALIRDMKRNGLV
jgi:methylphosphotriester-DNA--protein-cysteine methyltransferase